MEDFYFSTLLCGFGSAIFFFIIRAIVSELLMVFVKIQVVLKSSELTFRAILGLQVFSANEVVRFHSLYKRWRVAWHVQRNSVIGRKDKNERKFSVLISRRRKCACNTGVHMEHARAPMRWSTYVKLMEPSFVP